ncbi:MAG: hypothetical protein M3Z02_08670 [Actinomycetota bacterium]|nr:hypothetical protein [Actinomycetota bacterium]
MALNLPVSLPAAPPVRWQRRLARVVPHPRRAPGAFLFVGVLVVGTTAVNRLDPRDADRLLAAISTDVSHLAAVPWLVLPASALVITGTPLWLWAGALLVVLAPLEQRLGLRQAATVFLGGHVVATLLTELPIAYAVAQGSWPDSALTRTDVGISYGFYATVAAAAGLLPNRLRWAVLGGTAAVLVGQLANDPDMSAAGHLIALGTGAGLDTVRRRLAPGRRPRLVPAVAGGWSVGRTTVDS